VITLVLGGARSGKSAVAERLAGALPPPVTYLATATVDPGDSDHAARVAAHVGRRDPSWTTVEVGAGLVEALRTTTGTVLVDSLGTWVASMLDRADAVGELADVLARRTGDTVLVSEEVGMGVHPSSAVGRRFRDALGELNVAVAEVADEVLLVVAGRVLPLETR
jgi:adenosylcobinamide kinase / adenosylcobinamide-phosphate guanylyltransferase